MPKILEDKLKREYPGNKETKKGKAMEKSLSAKKK